MAGLPADDFSKLMQAMDLSQMLSDLADENKEQWRTHLLELLEVLDALDRTLDEHAIPAIPYKTVSLIRKQLELCLARVGVEPMNCKGQYFDPNIHKVVEVALSDEFQEDAILEEIVAGYRWQGEILRQPQVAIARPATSALAEPSSKNDKQEE